MRALLAFFCFATAIAVKCWHKEGSICVEALKHTPTCVPPLWVDRIACCMEVFSADATGNAFRHCSGMTLKQQFDKFNDESGEVQVIGRSKPVVHTHTSTDGHILGVVRKSAIKPIDSGMMIGRGAMIGMDEEDEKANIYGDYLGDYLYYHAFSGLFGDKLMLKFENQITKKSDTGEWEYYYRPYFPMSKYAQLSPDAFTVKQIMEMAGIALLDWLFFLNNDRLRFPHPIRVLFGNVRGNVMIDNYKSTQWRIIPIDNGAMNMYFGRDNKELFVSKRIKVIGEIINGQKGLSLWKLAQGFVDANCGSLLPTKWKEDKVINHKIAVIVFNTWYHYAARLATQIGFVLKNWGRQHDNVLFDGTNHFLQGYLEPILKLCKGMPGNIKVGTEAKYIKKQLRFGLTGKQALSAFNAEAFAGTEYSNFYYDNDDQYDYDEYEREWENYKQLLQRYKLDKLSVKIEGRRRKKNELLEKRLLEKRKTN